ncbi:MAG: dTMP kinase [Methylococcaceae bacterium]|nr:dTMP kinase [Methylococcaceae bacterium]
MSAKFITLEGGEGVGKTTQIAAVCEFLEQRGIACVATREPGGTPVGEQIRGVLLGNHVIAPETELLLLFAARAQHLQEVIRPALAKGHWVVCDRFTDASFAYQGGGRGVAEGMIEALQAQVQAGLQPALTLLLDAPVEIGLARAKRRGPADRFEQETVAFFQRVRAAYLARAERWPGRMRVIDASGTPEQVKAGVISELERFCP